MIEQKRVLGLIPARGGSKGIPHKNIRVVGEKPLLGYTIEAALGSRYVDDVVVTTDDADIAEVARECGASVPFLRPEEYARDESPTIECVVHAIEALRALGNDFDLLVLLQPTSPFRTANDIDRAVELFCERNKPVASVSPVVDNPILIRAMSADGALEPILNVGSTCRRQDMKAYYRVNGAIYVNPVQDVSMSTSFNDNPIGYAMDESNSLDIDTLDDLMAADSRVRNGSES